ncbi:Metal transporter CNNM4 [Symbiodinium microadriaticum]|uniref:Metal transporter CNNM4 n=1 Tax=Symbiodinium microadriaticum TaxID=2951 RepID=A0A1Q9CEF7_SYMMI|nr:Metal transporter CNNM4 [Symbiodinium microadriaticum]
MGSALVASASRRLASDEPGHVVALKASAMVVLAILSAIFSGLNLGLMCLDANQLNLLVKAADRPDAADEAKQQAAWAKRILPLREDGNLLLCTVLLGNVMVNSPVLEAKLTVVLAMASTSPPQQVAQQAAHAALYSYLQREDGDGLHRQVSDRGKASASPFLRQESPVSRVQSITASKEVARRAQIDFWELHRLLGERYEADMKQRSISKCSSPPMPPMSASTPDAVIGKPLSSPAGISKDDLLINQDFPVYSWNVGGIEGDYHTVIQNQVEGRPGNRRDGNGSETEWHVPQLVIGRLFGMAWVFDGLPSGYKDGGTLLDIADYQNLECNRTYSYGSREVESPGYLEPEIFHSDQEQTALVEHQVDSPVYLEPEIFNSDQVEGDETTATGASASTDRKPRMTQDLPEQDDQKLEKKQGPLDPEDRIPEKEEVHRQGAFSLGIWNRKGIEDEVKVVKGCSQRKPLQGSLAAFKRRESEASLMPVDSDCDVPTAGGAITQVGFRDSASFQVSGAFKRRSSADSEVSSFHPLRCWTVRARFDPSESPVHANLQLFSYQSRDS